MKKKIVSTILNLLFPRDRFHVSSKEVFGIKFYLFSDQHVGRKIILGKYEEHEVKFFLAEIKPSDVCLDVGANIGYFTFLFAKNGKKVSSIEPILSNVRLMQLTATINNIKNIEIINSLASDKEDIVKFVEAEETSLSGIETSGFKGDLVKNYGAMSTISYDVSSIILDNVHFEKLDIVKIDVEGAELKVLRGMLRTLKKHTPRLIMIEAVPAALSLHGDSFVGLLDFMRNSQYKPMILKSAKLVDYNGGDIPNDNLFFQLSNH